MHPDEIGRLGYPDFARYLDYYTSPSEFVDGFMDREDAADKLSTYHSIQQDIIRRAELKKKETISSGVRKDGQK